MACLFFIFLLFTLASNYVTGDIVLEEGYTVTTVLDGHKLHINPQSILPRTGSSDLIVLDSSGSVFYTVSFPIFQDSAIKRFSGSGTAGFSDGDSDSAMFNNPRSFAVDSKGNFYVSDKKNHVIRKISNSGVTTIAGGYSRKPGYVDGAAQNASFSDDFKLTFLPEKCVLLVSDHGNKMVRQINLKLEDCAKGSQSVLGAASIWIIMVLGVSCLLGFGFIAGFYARPYIIPHETSDPHFFNTTWKHYLINLKKQVLMLCFYVKSAIASSALYTLPRKLVLLGRSNVSLMFRVNIVDARISGTESVSLLDSDVLASHEIKQSKVYDDPLKDLISLDGNLGLVESISEREDEKKGEDVLSGNHGRIDNMIEANFLGFVEKSKKVNSLEGSLFASSGLVKRRGK